MEWKCICEFGRVDETRKERRSRDEKESEDSGDGKKNGFESRAIRE